MLLAFGLIVILAFSLFSCGAIDNWSAGIFEGSLFTLTAATAWRNENVFTVPRRLRVPFFLILGLALLGMVQLVPLKTETWKRLGDERGTLSEKASQAEKLLRSELYRTHPITGSVLPEDAGPLRSPPSPAWAPSSFAPALTLRAVWSLLAALALLLLLEHLGRQSYAAVHALGLSAGILGIVVGFTALAQFRPGVEKVMGLVSSAHAGRAFGPFINENNGVGFVNIAFCLLYYAVGRRWMHERRAGNRLGLWIIGGILLCAHITLLLIRTSGAGIWTLCLLPAAALLHLLRRRPKVAAGVALLALTGLVGVVGFALAHRLLDFHGRMDIWWNIFQQDHWALGNGLQSFSERFQAVLTDMPLRDPKWWLYPENEYLQLYFEGGSPGLLLGTVAVGYGLWLGWKAILAEGALFLLAPALWGEMLFALTDFQFHLWPTVFAYLTLIATLEAALLFRSNGNGPIRHSRPVTGGAWGHRPPSITGVSL